MRTRIGLLLWLGFVLSGLAGQTNVAGNAASRPATWAVKLNRPGLPNFFRITTNLYRGAQPTAQGMAGLKAMGIKTILNLRTFHSDKAKISGTGLKPERVKMEPWHASDDEVVRFLKFMADTNNLPVFVHCERGADRTGTMCAMYRVVCCGWTKKEAIRELKEGGFGFNPLWQNLVRYIEHADIEKLKRRAGLAGNRRAK
jgi:protein tyrosine/serine phosphatase